MKKLFRDFVKGAGYLPGYGDHPGGFPLLCVVALGIVAGMGRGDWISALIGGAVMFTIFFPLYVSGCIETARAYDAAVAKKKAEAPP